MKPSTAPPASEHDCRYLVGIDLGTTNSVVHYVDLEADRRIQPFPIPQLVALGEIAALPQLPSFAYVSADHEAPAGTLDLPWAQPDAVIVGTLARDQGALVPERLISSAKSWLAHAGVDRTRGILPWGSDLGDRKLSPLEVSYRFLEHIRQAWDHRMGSQRDRHGTPARLAEQQVLLTVPASFDDVARQLTVEAARRAGLAHLTLIEEPLAAFYAWLAENEDAWSATLQPGQTVLVVDVGGGTTDFSLVAIESGPTLRRTAVGDHLLLGGDNMDMALARRAEKAWGKPLPTRQWFQLCQLCRRAKEALLAADGPDRFEVAVSAPGSGVVAGMKTFHFTRDEVWELVLDGFFPSLNADSPPPERRRGIQEMGLPYAADPAITRHLLQFLRDAAPLVGAPAGQPLRPDAILYNGGALLPAPLRERLSATVGRWHGTGPVRELPAVDLNLAVARGAAYYGLVRRGQGVAVRGGLARAYYLQTDSGAQPGWLCVVPRDSLEGVPHTLSDRRFMVRTNQPVRFPLACSATRLGDAAGDLLSGQADLAPLAPLHTVLRYGRRGQEAVAVSLSAELNAVGTLDLWLQSCDSPHRFPLVFDLRSDHAAAAPGLSPTLDEAAQAAAEACLQDVFAGAGDPQALFRGLEDALGLPRDEWPLPVLRRLGDRLIGLLEGAHRTPRHEARWLNLTGFCLRPGFGAPGDEWRVGELWKLWHRGPRAAGQPQVAAEWWVLWRRLAGGLRLGQQLQIANPLVRELVPRPGEPLPGGRRPSQDLVERWRCLGSLERLPIETKQRLVDAILAAPGRLPDHLYWVVGRLGARRLFHGPADAVLPAEAAAASLKRLLDRSRREGLPRAAVFAAASLARWSGIRSLDLSAEFRQAVHDLLREGEAPESWQALLTQTADSDAEVTARIVGDRLPLGLSLADEPPDAAAG